MYPCKNLDMALFGAKSSNLCTGKNNTCIYRENWFYKSPRGDGTGVILRNNTCFW